MIASEDGSKVFFTDESRLTPGATAEPGKPDLYEYDLDRAAPERLQDLTVGSGEPADVLGVSGASQDGSYVYFVADGVLTGAQQNSQKAAAQAGQPNLYLRHAGATTFIATMDPAADSCDWMSPACVDDPLLGGLTARVSANGEFIAFDSDLSLTGYDNTGSRCVPELTEGDDTVRGFAPGACQEIFLYGASASQLSCASCDPDGDAPTGPAVIRFPSHTDQSNENRQSYPQRNVSDAGQVFFESPDALVAGDTNGKLDVYEYQAGQMSLLSSGTSDANSLFLDASVDGSDVFFATAQRLLPRDSDGAYDIYDARTGGGFAERAGSGLACEEGGCKAPGGMAPGFAGPGASAVFSGAGNLAAPVPVPVVSRKAAKKRVKPCRARYVGKKRRCTRKHTLAKGRTHHV